ncbi:S8 family serine peptidase [Pseudohongiella sp.]|uniref:Peptidase S8/S53 domain-containing protein n=1 Tax=marine sediment metagenome TaxID=412755 RepID=A0A0F9YI02_9ZZZZ|nr:S8 family serine peptidase [Pseudohongiella sp.]HDZ08470.1 hypothetical protein [Pseudohongiella sp.]
MPIQFLPDDEDVRSTNTGSQTAFTIENNTEGLIGVFWIDHSGSYKPYGYVSPGGEHSFNTNTGHPWFIETVNDDFKFFPTQKGVIEVNNKGPVFVTENDSSEQFFGTWSTLWGHGVPDVAKALDIDDAHTPLIETQMNNHAILNMLNVPAAWAQGLRGDGVKVAVLDSGIYTHEELEVFHEYDVTTRKNDSGATAEYLHGLRVASPIAARYDEHKYNGSPVPDISGVAPNAQIIDVRITQQGGGSNAENIKQGIDHALQQGAKVIQISQINNGNFVSPIIMESVKKAFDSGALVVWAGGNFGSPNPTGLALSSLTGMSISVGNYNFDNRQPFGSSNLAGVVKSPYVFAPSNGYYPDGNEGYERVVDGGTSYASPYVSGIAALLFQKYPDATVSDIIDLIVESSWIPSVGRGAVFNSNGNRIVNLDLLDQVTLDTAATDVILVDGQIAQHSFTVDSADKRILTFDNQQFDFTGADRIKFDDRALAFDMEGKAGDALEIMFALTQRLYFDDPNIVGILLNKLDTLHRDEVVEFAALNVLGPNWDARQLIATTAQNIYGLGPDSGIVDVLLAVQNTSGASDMDLFWDLAESEQNHVNIGLVGMQADGLEYNPVYG